MLPLYEPGDLEQSHHLLPEDDNKNIYFAWLYLYYYEYNK